MPFYLELRVVEAEGKAALHLPHLIHWDNLNVKRAFTALSEQLSEPYQHFACIVNSGKRKIS